MIRAIRMSKIPVWYSEGFNPHPYISFALPLSLGFESSYDVMDLRLYDEEYPLNNVLEKIKTVMPDGIEILGIGEPVMKTGGIAFADYQINYAGIDNNLKNSILDFLSSSEILTEKKNKKGKFNTVNLAEGIKSYEFQGDTLCLCLSAGANNLNPKLLLETFENKNNIKLPFSIIVRTMLYNSELEKFK